MKLAVPAAVIVFASGMCCCCGGDWMDEAREQIEREMGAQSGASSSSEEISASSDGTTVTVTTSEPSSSGDDGYVAVSGVCGPFKTMGVKAPAGFSVMVCSDQGPNSSLILTGSGDPVAACKPLKAWVEGLGFEVQASANMGGTSSIVSQKPGGAHFTIACTNATGPTLITLALSAN